MKKGLLTYSISIVVALAIILGVCGGNGVFTKDLSGQETMRFVCDGFFVVAALFLGVSLIVWTGKQGVFDGLGYSMSLWTQKFTNRKRDWHKKEEFHEYKERVAEKRKKREVNHLLIIGGVFAILTAVSYLVYKFAF